ncbi:Uncharacterised protein [Mycobacteroides abscessus]|nr:Uncharacterised protein [Mycobacteroides abscessus]
MVATTGSGVSSVHVKRLGGESRLARLLIEHLQLPRLLGKAGRGGHVDLDDPWIGGDAHRLDPRIRRWPIPFDHQRTGHRRLDARDEIHEVVHLLQRRQKQIQQAVTNFRDQSGDRRALGRHHHSGRRGPLGSQFRRGAERVCLCGLRRRLPGNRVQGQPEPGRRIAVGQHDPAAAQCPIGAFPTVLAPVQGQHIGRRLGHRLVQTVQ